MSENKDLAPQELQQPDEAAKATPQPAHVCPTCDSCKKRGNLYGYNWLQGISGAEDFNMVQVQFKNTRVGYYSNPSGLHLKIGDMVVVEASPGHDVGEVTMVGRLVALQMKKANLKSGSEIKKIYRIARQNDLDRYNEARAREHETMIQSRKIAESLDLNMKIGDVEFQGDGAKAIFYYIADERVDFRKLIRILADTFKIRIEMKQIGARQEAGRIGGIGPCGRPLCCASWMTHFVSVGTSAARFQDISMNPQKLAGQCAKLKCCLNFEVDVYMESQKKLPPKDAVLQTKDADYFLFKTDILSRQLTYSTDKSVAANLVTIDARRAFDIIALNRNGVKVDSLEVSPEDSKQPREFVDLVGQESLTRFDKSKKKKKRKSQQSQPQNAKQQGAKQPDGQQQQPRPKKNKQKKANANPEKQNGNPQQHPQQPRRNKPQRHDNRKEPQD